VLSGVGDPPRPLFTGAILAPWPNRIADGRFVHHDETHQLPINEPVTRCALHGLVAWNAWLPIGLTRNAVQFMMTIYPQPGYPYEVHLRARYDLDSETGLSITIAARNSSPRCAPSGVSIHPYLTTGAGRVDDWTLHLEAAQVMSVDDKRLLHTGLHSLIGARFDFQHPKRIEDVAIDHAFTGVALARAALLAPV
jgi:aldose 1-epimerase